LDKSSIANLSGKWLGLRLNGCFAAVSAIGPRARMGPLKR
jgi:hypothetical protein